MPHSHPFKRVALVGRQRKALIESTLRTLQQHLQTLDLEVLFEEETAKLLNVPADQVVTRETLQQRCDLLIVVGGDGSMLHTARLAVDQNLPVLGINRGRLGFLTDISPEEFAKIDRVLAGEYVEEQRFLLTADLSADTTSTPQNRCALNDVILMPGKIAHMIEFEVYINQTFVCSQRADGLIVATPTGSTAYALSAGGPILHPQLDAVVLIPMYPHTLTSRPIVLEGDSVIDILVPKTNTIIPEVSCDGQPSMPVQLDSQVRVQKKKTRLRLIHPIDYNYFETLRAKLHWHHKK